MTVEHRPTERRPGMAVIHRIQIGIVIEQYGDDTAVAEPRGFVKRRNMFTARCGYQIGMFRKQALDGGSVAQFDGGK